MLLFRDSAVEGYLMMVRPVCDLLCTEIAKSDSVENDLNTACDHLKECQCSKASIHLPHGLQAMWEVLAASL